MRYVTIESLRLPCRRSTRKRRSWPAKVGTRTRPARPASAVAPGTSVGGSASASGSEHERGGEHGPRREHGPRDVVHLELPVDAAARVRERREDDRERARERPPAALRSGSPASSATPRKPERDAGDPDEPDPLVREEPGGEDEREDRHRRLRDAGDARVDVRLAPGDEPHRHGGVDDAEHERTDATPARSSPTARARAHAPRDVGGEQDPREQHAELRHRRRRDVLDGNLDEEVRGAPHRRRAEDQRPVRAHRARLPTACGLEAGAR